jgi:hypothetical protein
MGTEPESGALLDIIADSGKSTRLGHVLARARPAVAAAVVAGCLISIGGGWAGARAAPLAPAAQGTQSAPPARPAPAGTTSELMVKIIYPASDAIFYVTTRTPSNDVEWNELQGKALMVAESGNLLLMPGYMRDEDRWMADARLMRDAGAAAFKAAKAKNVDALADLNDALYQSCVTCHMHYRPNYGRR